MKSVVLLLLVAVLGFVCAGPIDDGLLGPNPRQVDPDNVDAVVIDVNNEPPRPTYRRRFMRPYFDRDDASDEDDDDFGFGSFLGERPYGGFGFGYRPYGGEDFFTRLRHQMEMFRRYMTSMWNITSGFGPAANYPPNYKNSTYTVKEVNGSVISVNETIKTHSTNDSSFSFTFKVIKIQPKNETTVPVDETVLIDEPSAWPIPFAPEIPERNPNAENQTTEAAESESSTLRMDPDDVLFNDVNQDGLKFK